MERLPNPLYQLTFCAVHCTSFTIRSTLSFIFWPCSRGFISENFCAHPSFVDSGEASSTGFWSLETSESLPSLPSTACFITRILSIILLQCNCTLSTNSVPLFWWKDSWRSPGKFDVEADCSALMSLSALLDCKESKEKNSLNRELIVSFRIFVCVCRIIIWAFDSVFGKGFLWYNICLRLHQ